MQSRHQKKLREIAKLGAFSHALMVSHQAPIRDRATRWAVTPRANRCEVWVDSA